MNILVINVSLRPQSPIKLFPVGLGYIATAMKYAGYDFDVLDIDAHRYSDAEVERFIRNKQYDVVCMGCIVTGYKIVKSLAALIKEHHPNAKIIVGNSVATSIVEILLTRTKADIAVISEGDITIVNLLNTIANSGNIEEVNGICFVKDGKIVRTPPQPLIKGISSLPFIDFSIFDVEVYIDNSKLSVGEPLPIPREEVRALPVNTARGCVANCGFCYHVFKGTPYRYRTPDSIVAEVKTLIDTYSLNYINFWDELTFFSRRQSEALAQKIIDEDVHFHWVGSCRANLFKDDDDVFIMEKLKQAGCVAMCYSLESADPEILKAMNKKITTEQFARQTELLRKAGIPVATALVLGYPQETPETIKKTFDCCVENRIYPSSGYLLPQPGSQMYDYAIEHGFIDDEEEYLMKMGDRQDLRLNMTQMSDEEFETHVLNGLRKCNKALGLGIDENQLAKSSYYRHK